MGWGWALLTGSKVSTVGARKPCEMVGVLRRSHQLPCRKWTVRLVCCLGREEETGAAFRSLHGRWAEGGSWEHRGVWLALFILV